VRVGEAFVSIRADSKGFDADLVESGGKAKAALGGIASFVGGIGLGALFVSGVKGAGEQEKATRQVDSILRTMGGTISTSTADIDKWSASLSKSTAVSAGQVKEGASVLLTFANLRSGIGATDEGMQKVLATTTGLSKFWGTDMKGQAIQLGKALDNPIAGIGALAEVGITFTEQQKATIKTMVDTGNVAGAQTLILDELGKQGGDAGQQMATGSEKAAVAFDQMKTSVGAGVVPVMNSLGKILTPLIDAFTKLPGPVQTGLVAMVAVGAVAPRISATAQALGSLGPIASKMGPQVAKGAGAIAPAVTKGLAALGPGIASAGAALGPVLMTALPWIALVAGIVIVGVLIYKFFKSDLPGKIWDAMKDAGKWLVDAGGKIIGGLWEGLKKIGMVYKFFYVDLPLKVLGAVADAGKWLLDAGTNIVKGLAEGILGAHKWVLDAIMSLGKKILGAMTGIFKFGSPSKVFADMGGQLMAGLADGIAGSSSLPGAELAKMKLTAPTVAMPGGFTRPGASGTAGNGAAPPVVVNLDLRGATVGVDDLIDKVAAGLDARNRRLGVLG